MELTGQFEALVGAGTFEQRCPSRSGLAQHQPDRDRAAPAQRGQDGERRRRRPDLDPQVRRPHDDDPGARAQQQRRAVVGVAQGRDGHDGQRQLLPERHGRLPDHQPRQRRRRRRRVGDGRDVCGVDTGAPAPQHDHRDAQARERRRCAPRQRPAGRDEQDVDADPQQIADDLDGEPGPAQRPQPLRPTRPADHAGQPRSARPTGTSAESTRRPPEDRSRGRGGRGPAAEIVVA